MASPQADKYVKLSNELYEAIMQSDFTKRQRNILDMVIRLSYGCAKKFAIIRHSDFELCGVGKNHIKSELTYLAQSKVLTVDGDVIALNKDYDEWRISLVKKFDIKKWNEILNKNISVKSVPKTGTEEKVSSQNRNHVVPETGTDTAFQPSDTNTFEPWKESIKEINNNNINNNNNESPNTWIQEFEADYEKEADKRSLIEEIEREYQARKGMNPELPLSITDSRLIKDLIDDDKFTKEEIFAGIDQAFLTAARQGKQVFSFKYCISAIVSVKEEKHQKKNVIPFKQQKKQPYKKPESRLPKAIREQMEREERAKLGIPEPEPTPEELAEQQKVKEDIERMLREMEHHKQKGEVL
jgi:hypothetical protein